MPLIRIDVIEGRTEEDLTELADAVHETMLSTFAAPAGDRYQIVSEHRPGRMFIEDTGLDIERSADVVVVQVIQQGRSEEQKRALYAELARVLKERCGLRGEDLVVSVIENTRADWSFGFGRAQFLEGEL